MTLKYLIRLGRQNQFTYAVSTLNFICLLQWATNLQTSVRRFPREYMSVPLLISIETLTKAGLIGVFNKGSEISCFGRRDEMKIRNSKTLLPRTLLLLQRSQSY